MIAKPGLVAKRECGASPLTSETVLLQMLRRLYANASEPRAFLSERIIIRKADSLYCGLASPRSCEMAPAGGTGIEKVRTKPCLRGYWKQCADGKTRRGKSEQRFLVAEGTHEYRSGLSPNASRRPSGRWCCSWLPSMKEEIWSFA